MKYFATIFLAVTWMSLVSLMGEYRVFPEGTLPQDRRLQPLKDLNGHFPFAVPENLEAWEARAAEVRQRVLVSTGLWPMPQRTRLNAVIHGKSEREGFTVEKVYFESVPGFFVTGLLFRPQDAEGRCPAVLSPHGHGGRLQDHGPDKIRDYIVQGAERFENSGRFPKVARCAQLARMGCVTFLFDMIGYADNQQLSEDLAHRFAEARPTQSRESWGLYSAQAELRLQSVLGLQVWNAVRALDFLESLPDVDPERMAVTGGSGGGTQTILLGAIDSRPVAAFPQGMVSTSMQGGCTCENTTLLRIGTGNVELTALFAPRPQAMTAANDWTKAMLSDGYPELQQVYQFYNAKDAVSCSDLTHFPHNYNYVARAQMYAWFNRHLNLGLKEPIVEEDFPMLTAEEHAVWTADHPQPKGGDAFETALLKRLALASEEQVAAMPSEDVRSAWTTLIGRSVPTQSEVTSESLKVVVGESHTVSLGTVQALKHGEVVPTVAYLAEGERKHFALWIHGKGKAALEGEDGALLPEMAALLAGGVSVVTADLFGQGEFLADGGLVSRNRKVASPRAFAGYTYGYNDTLFAQRVHDILTLLASLEVDAETVTLIGTDGAGPLVAVAAMLAGDVVTRVALETDGFRFANLEDYRSAQFLPGAVKYGDLPTALALVSPTPLWLRGEPSLSGIEGVTLALEGGDWQEMTSWVLGAQ